MTMAENTLSFGRKELLQFDVYAEDTGRGGILAWLNGQPVWNTVAVNGEPRPVNCALISFFRAMGTHWITILLQQHFPLSHIDAESAKDFVVKAYDQIIDDVIEDDREHHDADEEKIWLFKRAHNIRHWVDGVKLPELYVMRWGNGVAVTSGDHLAIVPMDEFFALYEGLGQYLAQTIAATKKTAEAHAAWAARKGKIKDAVGALTGLPGENYGKSWARVTREMRGHSFTDLLRDSEIFATARMIGDSVSDGDMVSVLETVKILRKERGNAHSGEMFAIFAQKVMGQYAAGYARGKPFQEGFGLAEIVRYELCLGDAKVDMTEVMRSITVDMWFAAMPLPVDVLALWGDKRLAPCVVVNSAEGSRMRYVKMRQIAVAHEICHALVDKDRALPMGDVLCERKTRVYIEQRAKAFAAELLLPRKLAAERIRNNIGASAIRDLGGKYGVTESVAAWQLLNAVESGFAVSDIVLREARLIGQRNTLLY